MELRHIELSNLTVSAANMRAKGKAPDIGGILSSVRARGILVPLIVRANGQQDHYEIVAGKRRYHAALTVAEEAGGIDPLPCAVMDAGDDAAALEASLIENVARLDPDEVTRWESFTRLVKEGRTPEQIALTFGLTELQRHQDAAARVAGDIGRSKRLLSHRLAAQSMAVRRRVYSDEGGTVRPRNL
jgi:ParB family chromosome partitioning protein